MDIVARAAGSGFTALLVFGRDFDGGRRSLVEVEEIGLAVHRDDAVAVGRLRIGSVIAPLKGLHRVLGRRDRRPGRQTFILGLEPLDAPEPEALKDRAAGGKLGALDRKPEKLFAFGFLARHEIPGQGHDVQPADSANCKNRSLFDIAHELSSGSCTSHSTNEHGYVDTQPCLCLNWLTILVLTSIASARFFCRSLADIHLTRYA